MEGTSNWIHWASIAWQDEEMMLNVRLVTILASAMFQESSLDLWMSVVDWPLDLQ